MVWSECRKMASGYFSEMSGKLKKVAAPAQELSQAYKEIAALLEKAGGKEMPAEEKTGILTDLKAREQAAVDKVRGLLKLLG